MIKIPAESGTNLHMRQRDFIAVGRRHSARSKVNSNAYLSGYAIPSWPFSHNATIYVHIGQRLFEPFIRVAVQAAVASC